ncbi:hypothetical protein EJ06DRAFT_476510 [Trichodelitschia bisporula]|uniref:Formin GTPase-binding domain-containing protein n=1 Tax=Trichodelitschia bisporula TaxID=703511 RepID=A0A6G1HYZ5_9PEZI|nr:hypothetical protein EJ06DRAFT_476510 [Trichodelitschia bisporula]
MLPSKLRPSPADDTPPAPPSPSKKENTTPYAPFNQPFLPPNHPHAAAAAAGNVLNEVSHNVGEPKRKGRGLHKRTKSAVSLRSLGKDKKDDKDKKKGKAQLPPVDKENTPVHSPEPDAARTPIWAQFASQSLSPLNASVAGLEDPFGPPPPQRTRTVDEEIALYEPTDYDPSKQRNFHGTQAPTLTRRGGNGGPRPKSEAISAQSAGGLLEAIQRKVSGGRRESGGEKEMKKEEKEGKKVSTPRGPIAVPKRGSRVMAAVSMFNSKAREAEPAAAVMDGKTIDEAFEAVLDSRNIPENMRPNMRSLRTSIKMDFIRSHKDETLSAKAPASVTQRVASNGSTASDASTAGSEDKKSTKRARPRSRAFTFSKSENGRSKKQKADGAADSKRNSRVETLLPKSPSTQSLSQPAGQPRALPEEYVAYLRGEQKPEKVEVGRLHKLRLLIRNETVSWVETFIQMGGMREIVGLLHRIMEVEWREDHEDHLLHETLLCLKGLCTTSIGLTHLQTMESTLFPALLAMLFDPEHKGPSEFTTRGLIITILLAHLTAAVPSADPGTLPARAHTILSYLADPSPPEDKTPVPFILEMRQRRPYKVWAREVTNVTKEVFWIFLHAVNVVPLPEGARPLTSGSTTEALAEDIDAATYARTFFPQPRPPVPAAPYIGGVEWDATNYMAAHLDLLNGLIASLPTRTERNALRAELRASGWEKVMGGQLRTCKEKFYSAVHDGLRTWVAAGVRDGWDVAGVRKGVFKEGMSPVRVSPTKRGGSPVKGGLGEAPKLELGLSLGGEGGGKGWI